jgi:hypothetical protein
MRGVQQDAVSRTRFFSTVSPRSQPILSAITVADIVGYAFSSSRIRGSAASTIDPAGRRTYFAGPSLASAVRTVFLEIPSSRAIAFTGMPSARCSRRISAQPALTAPFLPGSAAPGRKGANLRSRHALLFGIQRSSAFRQDEELAGYGRVAQVPGNRPAGFD